MYLYNTDATSSRITCPTQHNALLTLYRAKHMRVGEKDSAQLSG